MIDKALKESEAVEAQRQQEILDEIKSNSDSDGPEAEETP